MTSLLSGARSYSERDFLLLLLTFWHGLRVSEVLQITPHALRDGRIRVQRLKGSKATDQELVAHENPLFDERSAVAGFCQNLVRNQRLFPIGRRRADQLMKHYAALADIPKVKRHMHVLKHTAGTLSYQGCKDIKAVQALLGHSSLNSTSVYVEIDPSVAAATAQRSIKL